MDADEKGFDRSDPVLSKTPVRIEDKYSLYLYADMFTVWNRGHTEIRGVKGRIADSLEDSAVQSICKRRV